MLAVRSLGAVRTNDGVRAYTWDGENRLTEVEPVSPANGDKKVAMQYDYMGRRVSKVVSEYTNSAWTAAAINLFVYDGWNVVGETRLTPGGVSTNLCVCGLDLSGSLQGAGGSDQARCDTFCEQEVAAVKT